MRLSLFAVAPHGGWRKVVPDSSQPLGLEQKAFGFDGAAKPVGELEKVSARPKHLQGRNNGLTALLAAEVSHRQAGDDRINAALYGWWKQYGQVKSVAAEDMNCRKLLLEKVGQRGVDLDCPDTAGRDAALEQCAGECTGTGADFEHVRSVVANQ
jgi:hypothetical protein